MSSDQNLWFVNFSGIGNGIAIAPILLCFERSYPCIPYFHSENQVLYDQWFIDKAGLKNLNGFSPIEWRRFEEKYWDRILAFIKTNNIGTIVNLRNEGPRYDIDYYRFKKTVLNSKEWRISFWDLDFATIEARSKQENLTKDILALFASHNIDISEYNPKWLSSIREKGARLREIGFGMAAGQRNKRWPVSKWIELGRKIMANSSYKIILLPGTSKEEINCAKNVRRLIGIKNCESIYQQPLKKIAIRIGKLGCLISNDTGLLHIAAAVGTPSVGLYTNTNADIWAPYAYSNFVAYQNSFIERCPAPKIHCGNCFHYYDICPAITEYGDDIYPNKVYEIINVFFNQALIHPHTENFTQSRCVNNPVIL